MSTSPHDSCSNIQHSLDDLHTQWKQTPSHHKTDMTAVVHSSSFDENKLMRGPSAEPRDFVYVYDYSQNKTRRIKTQDLLQKLGEFFPPFVSIPHHPQADIQTPRKPKYRTGRDSVFNGEHSYLHGQRRVWWRTDCRCQSAH